MTSEEAAGKETCAMGGVRSLSYAISFYTSFEEHGIERLATVARGTKGK